MVIDGKARKEVSGENEGPGALSGAVFVRRAAIGMGNVTLFEITAADAGDGKALGVDRRDVEAAGLYMGDAIGLEPVDEFHHHLTQLDERIDES